MSATKKCSGGGKLTKSRYDREADTFRTHCSVCGQVVEQAGNGGAVSHVRPLFQYEIDDIQQTRERAVRRYGEESLEVQRLDKEHQS